MKSKEHHFAHELSYYCYMGWREIGPLPIEHLLSLLRALFVSFRGISFSLICSLVGLESSALTSTHRKVCKANEANTTPLPRNIHSEQTRGLRKSGETTGASASRAGDTRCGVNKSGPHRLIDLHAWPPVNGFI